MNERTKRRRSRKTDTYVVTEDLSILLPLWCEHQGVAFQEEAIDFAEILERLCTTIKDKSFPDEDEDTKVDVVPLPRTTLDNLLHKHDSPENDAACEFWVSLDDVYPTPRKERDDKYNVSITRYIGTDWRPLDDHRGPRPEWGKKSILEQVRECINMRAGMLRRYNLDEEQVPLVLVDDGTFGGGTIREILTQFAEQEHFVESIRLGVAQLKGVQAIARWHFKDKEQRVHVVPFIGASKMCPPIKDWICERDFFPGVLYSGKVVGERRRGRIQALRVGSKGLPVRAQYLHDWGDVIGWASVPSDRALPFTASVLGICIDLWERLEKLKGQTVLVEDLPAVPHKIYRDNPERMEEVLQTPWLEILRKEKAELDLRLRTGS